jgi:hypothetical protein
LRHKETRLENSALAHHLEPRVTISVVIDLRPATAADAAILALHHYQHLLETGFSDADATRSMGAFLPWARGQLEAGALIALIAGGGLEADGSVVLHILQRPAPYESAELLFVHAPPELTGDLVQAVLLEAKLRGVTRVVTTNDSRLEDFGFIGENAFVWHAD